MQFVVWSHVWQAHESSALRSMSGQGSLCLGHGSGKATQPAIPWCAMKLGISLSDQWWGKLVGPSHVRYVLVMLSCQYDGAHLLRSLLIVQISLLLISLSVQVCTWCVVPDVSHGWSFVLLCHTDTHEVEVRWTPSPVHFFMNTSRQSHVSHAPMPNRGISTCTWMMYIHSL